MAKYISSRNPISSRALRRKPVGSVVIYHWTYGEIRFTRVRGGWRAEREDYIGISPVEVVSSTIVANECNKAVGCKSSWARVY